MAAFANKQIKIKLLCERALQEDILREELASQNLMRQQIDEIIRNKRMEKYRKPLGTHPIDENLKVVKILDKTNIGLADTHRVMTSTQEFNSRAQKKLEKFKTFKKAEKEHLQELMTQPNLPHHHKTKSESLDNMRQKLMKQTSMQFELDRSIKEQRMRDHLHEMHKGLDQLNKAPKGSHYAEHYVFDNPMQELCDNVNFDHHLLKNDLKWFTEMYIKYKATLRK